MKIDQSYHKNKSDTYIWDTV